MSTSSINNLSSYLQPELSTALQGAGLHKQTSTTSLQPDNSQLSPFAQLMSTLQQIQQSDPAKYKEVTQQISTNLQKASQTAQANGNTTAANQLSQLSADFATASQTGQLPNFQNVTASAGGHRHHHHHGGGDADASATSAASATSQSSSSSTLLAALQASETQNTSATQNESLNAMTIISNTLSNA